MSQKPLFALVDCNNFFVSCERIFRPDLEAKPVVVLSSNDGCVVARSNEAKALGIPMAAPAFKYRQTFKDNRVVSFSANFSLYGDISRRIIDILTTITPRTEVYSVDESFLDISELLIKDYVEWGAVVRQRILDWVGIPVSIGIAPTKTLAKLASEHAKTNLSLKGVLTLQGQTMQVLKNTPVGEVWGVGRRLAPQLKVEGIHTAFDLAHMRPQHARQLMGVHGAQLIAELSGGPCHTLQPIGKPCQSIARTRTFGEDTSDFGTIEAAIATFVAQAAYQLRESKQLTKKASVFITSNKDKPGYKYWSRDIHLDTPTADTGMLITRLIEELPSIYSPSSSYHRAGIALYDFVSDSSLQLDLLGMVDSSQHDQNTARMQAIDGINKKYGKRHVRYAAEQLGNAWKPKYKLRSPRYTTHFAELPRATIFIE